MKSDQADERKRAERQLQATSVTQNSDRPAWSHAGVDGVDDKVRWRLQPARDC